MGRNNINCLFYAFEVYAEHFTESELDIILERGGIPCCRSPCHKDDKYSQRDFDRFVESNDNEPEWSVGDNKKAHWHVIFQNLYSRQPLASLKYIQNIFPLLNIVYIVPCPMIVSSCRYLCHLDNPEKTQYKKKDVKSFGGFVPDFNKPEPYKPLRCVRNEIVAAISSNNIKSLSRLMSIYNDDDSVISYIERHTYLVVQLLNEQKGF